MDHDVDLKKHIYWICFKDCLWFSLLEIFEVCGCIYICIIEVEKWVKYLENERELIELKVHKKPCLNIEKLA